MAEDGEVFVAAVEAGGEVGEALAGVARVAVGEEGDVGASVLGKGGRAALVSFTGFGGEVK